MLQFLLPLIGWGKDYTAKRQEIELKKDEAKAEAVIKRMNNSQEWEQHAARLSSRFLRWCCALHLFAGLDFTIYLVLSGDPNPGKLFTAFDLLPEWYAGLLMTMFGWAFASQPIKDAGGKLAALWRRKKNA